MNKPSTLGRHLITIATIAFTLGIPGLFALGGTNEKVINNEKGIKVVGERLDDFGDKLTKLATAQAAIAARLEEMDKSGRESRDETRQMLMRILDKMDDNR